MKIKSTFYCREEDKMKEIYVSNKQLKKYNECDNSILPERLMGIKEGDVLAIRNKEERN